MLAVIAIAEGNGVGQRRPATTECQRLLSGNDFTADVALALADGLYSFVNYTNPTAPK
jgi:hypothetical protein